MIPLDQFDAYSLSASDPNSPTQPLRVEEHKDVPLPPGVLRPDGSIDIFDEVQRFLEIKFSSKHKALTVRSNGWIGQIPLNDRTSLQVDTKTPVANLERIIDRATFPSHATRTLENRRRDYGATHERPSSLMDVLTDGFLAALDLARHEGLLKSYAEQQREDAAPAGRPDPIRSAIRTRTAGRPLALSTRFERTLDTPANRLASLAIDRLVQRYGAREGSRSALADRVISAREAFPRLPPPSRDEMSPMRIGRLIRSLPRYHQEYGPMLRLAGHLVADLGLNLQRHEGLASAAVVLVKLDEIFEGYCRNTLLGLSRGGRQVLDGNLEGDGGDKRRLYTDLAIPQAADPTAKPDIVIVQGGSVRLLIDVKYRLPSAVPDRDVVNQLACYAVRYGCSKVMSLYPARPEDRQVDVELVGKIGSLAVYRGTLDTSRADLGQAETELCEAIEILLEE